MTSLLYISPKRGLLYVTDTRNSATKPAPSNKFEHLSCFLPGLLALGANTLPDSAFEQQQPHSERPTLLDEAELRRHDWRELHMLAAEGLAESCYQMYADQPTGLGPNEVLFYGGGELWIRRLREWRMAGKVGLAPGIGARKLREAADADYSVRSYQYMLRPEVRHSPPPFAMLCFVCRWSLLQTIESIYLMFKFTGNERWRERGWDIFQALEKHAKTQVGFATVANVAATPAVHKDEMPR